MPILKIKRCKGKKNTLPVMIAGANTLPKKRLGLEELCQAVQYVESMDVELPGRTEPVVEQKAVKKSDGADSVSVNEQHFNQIDSVLRKHLEAQRVASQPPTDSRVNLKSL